jgi:prolyl 4-hydroxylase
VLMYTEPCRLPAPVGDSLTSARLRADLSHDRWIRLHAEPPIFYCDGFLSHAQCDALMNAGRPLLARSTVRGREHDARRTSRSCGLPLDDPSCVPLFRKVHALTAKDQRHFEPAQVTQYVDGQFYREHNDAPNAAGSASREACSFMAQGGQRLATILVYLNDVERGGATGFPTLGCKCSPKRGRCLLFFPGLSDGRRDDRLLHAAEEAIDEKWVAQLWVRQYADPLWALQPPRRPTGCKTSADIYQLVCAPDGDG